MAKTTKTDNRLTGPRGDFVLELTESYKIPAAKRGGYISDVFPLFKEEALGVSGVGTPIHASCVCLGLRELRREPIGVTGGVSKP